MEWWWNSLLETNSQPKITQSTDLTFFIYFIFVGLYKIHAFPTEVNNVIDTHKIFWALAPQLKLHSLIFQIFTSSDFARNLHVIFFISTQPSYPLWQLKTRLHVTAVVPFNFKDLQDSLWSHINSWSYKAEVTFSSKK